MRILGNERIFDAQPAVDYQPVVHVFGTEQIAIGNQRRGDDHAIVNRQAIVLRQSQTEPVRLQR